MLSKRIFWILWKPLQRCFFNDFPKKQAFNFKYENFSKSSFNNLYVNKSHTLLMLSTLTFTFVGNFYVQKTRKTNKIDKIAKLNHEEFENLLSNSRENALIFKLGKRTDLKKIEFNKQLRTLINNDKFVKLNINLYYIEDEEVESNKIISIFMYNGYTENQMSIDKYIDYNEIKSRILNFFTPKSENINLNEKSIVKRISYNNFEVDVIKKSSRKKPLLLMYYEQYCLMCFLIRPFINSVASKLRDVTDMQFARFNIDKNHLHISSPFISATPTFVLYRGTEKPEKWSEYKPMEITKKILENINGAEKKDVDQRLSELKNLESKIYIRFQLFSILILWNLFLMDLQKISSRSSPDSKVKFLLFDNIEKFYSSTCKVLDYLRKNLNAVNVQDIDFGDFFNKNFDEHPQFKEMLLNNISKDMERSDTLEQNIDHLLLEIDEICNDCLALKALL